MLNLLENRKKVQLTITSAFQAPACHDALLQYKPNLVLGDQEVLGEGNDKINYSGFKALMDAGLNISLSVTSESRFSGKEAYLWCIANMYREGFSDEDILKMITINPAKTLGIDSELGSIEAGKVADIVLYQGSLMKTYKAKLISTIMNGKVTYER